MIELLEACKAGKPPKMGKWGSLPMNGQVSCEGPLGKTSLFEIPMDFKATMRKDFNFEPKVCHAKYMRINVFIEAFIAADQSR